MVKCAADFIDEYGEEEGLQRVVERDRWYLHEQDSLGIRLFEGTTAGISRSLLVWTGKEKRQWKAKYLDSVYGDTITYVPGRVLGIAGQLFAAVCIYSYFT